MVTMFRAELDIVERKAGDRIHDPEAVGPSIPREQMVVFGAHRQLEEAGNLPQQQGQSGGFLDSAPRRHRRVEQPP
jgi:hypothetical protein